VCDVELPPSETRVCTPHPTHPADSLADENALTALPTISSIYDELVLAQKKEVYVTIVTAQVCPHTHARSHARTHALVRMHVRGRGRVRATQPNNWLQSILLMPHMHLAWDGAVSPCSKAPHKQCRSAAAKLSLLRALIAMRRSSLPSPPFALPAATGQDGADRDPEAGGEVCGAGVQACDQDKGGALPACPLACACVCLLAAVQSAVGAHLCCHAVQARIHALRHITCPKAVGAAKATPM